MERTRIAMLFVAVLAVVAPRQLSGQEFDVASIKLNTGGGESYRIRTPPGNRFTATNVTVKTLILEAFDIKAFQLAGVPGWLDSERYDIDAKLAAAGDQAVITPEGLRPLMRALLASRFKLTLHREDREVTVYSLVATKGGAKLHANSGMPMHSTDWGKGHINANAVTVAEFGRVLETQLDRVVVDDSGIQGAFDFHLTWVPDQAVDSSGPSIFTAIQEQYGLKLESKKAPVGIFVMDHVERPSEN